jgi:predicted RNA-binding Zn-ribbon protein involved in translation (DUF1610 family)
MPEEFKCYHGPKEDDARYMSAICSRCGYGFQTLRDNSVFTCPSCGFKYDLTRATPSDLWNLSREELLKKIQVSEHMKCPDCGEEMVYDHNSARCDKCKKLYPITYLVNS